MPPPLEAIARRPRLAALLGALCIAFSGIFYRYAGVSPSTGTVFRCLFGLPILLGVAFLERRRFGPLPRATIRLAVIAGVFFAGDLVLWHHAIEAVGAGLATVLGNLQVFVVGFVAWAVLGRAAVTRDADRGPDRPRRGRAHRRRGRRGVRAEPGQAASSSAC